MIEWLDIENLPVDIQPGRSFLFCTMGKHIIHVTLVVHDQQSFCWSTQGTGASAILIRDDEMALVTHFAEPNLPEPNERQITAVAVRVANLDGRSDAYLHDRYGR